MRPTEFSIAGIGVTPQGSFPDKTELDLKADALELAARDAGVSMSEIDGYIFQPGLSDLGAYGRGGEAAKVVGMSPNFVWTFQAGGTSAIAGVVAACGAIHSGLADIVAVGYGDNSRSYQGGYIGNPGQLSGGLPVSDFNNVYGAFGGGLTHALAAQRHMAMFGTTREHLGQIMVTSRANALDRPDAVRFQKPFTMDDYLAAPMIAAPLGRHDYCLVSDGGAALIVARTERAAELSDRPPVHVAGAGLSTALSLVWDRTQYHQFGAAHARDVALRTAGLTIDDIEIAELYDCFTITVLMALEGYGFCGVGEAGGFIEDGNIELDGKIPVNTSGGQLAWGYLQGFTPIVEGVRQLRGEGGTTQVPGVSRCLVTGHGGVTAQNGNMEYAEACMILTTP